MLPVIPTEVLACSWELICCLLTFAAAVMSYVLMWRW